VVLVMSDPGLSARGLAPGVLVVLGLEGPEGRDVLP